MIIIRGWSSLPGADTSGTFGTVPSGLRATLYLIRTTSIKTSMVLLSYHPPLSSYSTLPYSPYPSDYSILVTPPSLHCCMPHPYNQDIQGRLLPPSTGYEHYRIPLHHQTQVCDRTSCNVLCARILVVGDINPDLINPQHCQHHPN